MNTNPFEQLLYWIIAYHLVVLTLWLTYLSLGIFATYQNLRDNRGIDRLTWVLAIWTPFGFIFYWILRDQPPERSQLPKLDPNYTPPPQDSNDIAAAIAADLAEQKRKRRTS